VPRGEWRLPLYRCAVVSGPYAGVLLEHFRRPRNRGVLPGAAIVEEGVNALCGDRVRMQVALDDQARITDARFVADACAVCIAAASLLTMRLEGLTLAQATEISETDVLGWLETELPAGRARCAALSVDALHRGVERWRSARADDR
jgi:nitrogen fixation protein NifU and related proteins